MEIELYTDGGARGNPGPGGAGIFLRDRQNKKEFSFGLYLGEVTNNQAEYLALINGLSLLANKYKTEDIKTVQVFMDSELVVKQLSGEYKVKDLLLKKLNEEVHDLVKPFPMVKFNHIRREKNETADALVNRVLDQQERIL